jgi:DNA-binding NarL/FixJ family response regulator
MQLDMGFPAKNLFEFTGRPQDGDGSLNVSQTRDVIVAEELTLLREGVVAIIDSTRRYRAIAHCGEGDKAFQLIQELQPDLAVLDFNLPGMFSLEIARTLRDAGITTRIVVLSTRCDRRSVSEAMRSGVSAFLPKTTPAKQLVEAFDTSMQGEVFIPPSLQFDCKSGAADSASPDPFENLSPREFQVFSLMVEGVRAKEIAARLGLSPKTVDTYRSNLMRKLDIHDLAGLVKFAIERELTSRR